MEVKSPNYGPAGRPSVGRTVHYIENGEPIAALITQVVSIETGVVDLTIFRPREAPEVVAECSFAEQYSEGCWSWAPRA